MKRLLLTTLLCFVLVFISMISVAMEYKEAPMLQEKVNNGELPSVSERLPEDPKVVEPLDSVGEYGGTLKTFIKGPDGQWFFSSQTNLESLLTRSQTDHNKILPNIARDWEMSEDKKSITLYLRKGLKWSDGKPFTVDDILFWWNDIHLNKELTPVIRKVWKPGGEKMEVVKIDDYTVKFEFAVPWPGAEYAFSKPIHYAIQGTLFQPKHYLKKFHIKYNPDVNELAEEEGHDHWFQLFQEKAEFTRGHQPNPDLPVLGPWKTEIVKPDHVTFVRNPYYWKVDTEGNQLPYIDKKLGILAEDSELRATKILSGEPDVTIAGVSIQKYPMVKKIADKQNYNVWLGDNIGATGAATVYLNHCIENPALNELFNNPKFKQALSLAINRQEINKMVLKGITGTDQVTVPKTSPLYEERFARAYADFKPDKAKQLLDELGLEENKDGYRLRSDGEIIHIVIEAPDFYQFLFPTSELVKDYWENIGIKTTVKATNEMWTHASNNTLIAGLWLYNQFQYSQLMVGPPWWAQGTLWGAQYQRWLATDGDQGMEPPEDVKKFFSIWEEFPLIRDEEERINKGKEALELLAENLWFIGIIGPQKDVRIVRKNIKNVNISNSEIDIGIYGCGGYKVFQWYFED